MSKERTEWLYKYLAAKKRRTLLMEFVYGQVLSIENRAETILKIHKGAEDSKSIEAFEEAEEILALCQSVRAYSEEM